MELYILQVNSDMMVQCLWHQCHTWSQLHSKINSSKIHWLLSMTNWSQSTYHTTDSNRLQLAFQTIPIGCLSSGWLLLIKAPLLCECLCISWRGPCGNVLIFSKLYPTLFARKHFMDFSPSVLDSTACFYSNFISMNLHALRKNKSPPPYFI